MKRAFLDRRQIMFGRKPDLEIILSRAKQKGFTAVVGRPKMGKTWLLQEVGRQLHEVGYLELRTLAQVHQSNDGVQQQLARSLVNSIIFTKKENDLKRRNELLDELCSLGQLRSHDLELQEFLATALFNSVHFAYEEQNLDVCDALITELKIMAQTFPNTRRFLTQSLVVSTSHNEKNPSRRGDALNKLRDLVQNHPDDLKTCEGLANGLFNVHCHALINGDLNSAELFLNEMRALARKFPYEPTVLTFFARCLTNAIHTVKSTQDLDRQSVLQSELAQVELKLAKLQRKISA